MAGCGSGELSDTDEIRETIRTAVLVHEPSECSEFATRAFLEQVSGQTGRAALRTCEDEAEDPTGRAESVTVEKVRARGTRATAVVVLAGLPGSHSERLVVTLVEDDGRWRLDEVRSDLTAGRSARASARRRLGELTDAPEQRCIERRIAATPQAENGEIDAATPFSKARGRAQLRGCFRSEARAKGAGAEIAPEGARYSFTVPPGFETYNPPELDRATAVAPVPRRNSGAMLVVTESGEPSAIRAGSLDELRALAPGLEEGLRDRYDDGGASVSELRVLTVAGLPAAAWVASGGRALLFPGVDEETTMVFPSTGSFVQVICTWARTEAGRRTIRRGCRDLLRSLRVS